MNGRKTALLPSAGHPILQGPPTAGFVIDSLQARNYNPPKLGRW